MGKYIIFLISISLLLLSCDSKQYKPPIAKKGVLDLRNWDLSKDGSIKLSGEWEFYWKKFIKPTDFKKNTYRKQYFNVPDYWNKKKVEETKLSCDGYATYRLKILHDTLGNFNLYVGEQMTSYKYWCDSVEVFSCGTVADNKATAVPFIKPRVQTIHLSKDTTELIFHISNYHHFKGGFFKAPILGSGENLNASVVKKYTFDIFLIGSIIIMAFYHIGLFFFRNGKLSSLLFGMVALLLSVRALFTGSVFISILFPYMSWVAQYRILYASMYLTAAILPGFIYFIYRLDVSKSLTILYSAICILFSLSVFLPTHIFTNPIFPFIAFLISIVYYFPITIKVLKNKRYGADIFVASGVIFFLAIVNDALLVRTFFIWDIELVSFGVFLFVLGQSLVFANITIKTLHENKMLSLKLKTKRDKISLINQNLQEQKRNLMKSEAKMRSFIKLLPEAIFELDWNGNITFANDEFYKQLIYVPDNTLNIENLIAKNENLDVSFVEYITSVTFKDTTIRELRVNMLRSDDSKFPATISLSRVPESVDIAFRGIFVDISQQITDEEIIDNAFREIKSKNKDIMDSLKYALTIQTAVMPSNALMESVFKEFFVINKPHTIVSGDFYYVNKKGNKTIFALSDCTGHGVPGGFMTMLGVTLLNELYGGDYIHSPDYTLDKMRTSVIQGLGQKSDYFGNKDGMDMILCVLDTETLMLEFASADQPLYIMRNDKLLIYNGDKMPVGIYLEMTDFSLQKVQLQKGDVLYLFSDGMVDIFGGTHKRRLYPKGLKKILNMYHKKPLKEQALLIEKKLKEWQGQNAQIDDMLMLGIRI